MLICSLEGEAAGSRRSFGMTSGKMQDRGCCEATLVGARSCSPSTAAPGHVETNKGPKNVATCQAVNPIRGCFHHWVLTARTLENKFQKLLPKIYNLSNQWQQPEANPCLSLLFSKSESHWRKWIHQGSSLRRFWQMFMVLRDVFCFFFLRVCLLDFRPIPIEGGWCGDWVANPSRSPLPCLLFPSCFPAIYHARGLCLQ